MSDKYCVFGSPLEQATELFYVWHGVWPDCLPVAELLQFPT